MTSRGQQRTGKELKPMQSRLPGPHHQLTVRQGKRPHTTTGLTLTGTYCWIFTAINESNNFTVTNGLSYFKNTQSIGVCCMAHCPGWEEMFTTLGIDLFTVTCIHCVLVKRLMPEKIESDRCPENILYKPWMRGKLSEALLANKWYIHKIKQHSVFNVIYYSRNMLNSLEW